MLCFVGLDNKLYKLHGTHIKILEALQAGMYNMNTNTKLGSLKKKAAIWYNKICKAKQLTPKYTHIVISGNNIKSKTLKIAAIEKNSSTCAI
jgi:hypothetical protein